MPEWLASTSGSKARKRTLSVVVPHRHDEGFPLHAAEIIGALIVSAAAVHDEADL